MSKTNRLSSAPWRLAPYISRLCSARSLFALALLTYLVVQVGLVITPVRQRTVPVETDDAYTYILKAVEMRACFRQDCPALNDLRTQVEVPTQDPDLAWLRYREYNRAFFVYHPLHSLVLNALNAAGLAWEAAYNAIAIGGSILIGLGIAAWLASLWGLGPAAMALFLLAFSLFPGQGLHYVVPSNLALGFAMLTWAWITRKGEAAGWPLAAGILAMLTMHSAGRLYALVALALYAFSVYAVSPGHRPQRRHWIVGGASLALIALAFLLPLVISRPELSVLPDPPPDNWQAWWGLRNNVLEAARVVAAWIEAYGGYLAVGLLLTLGLLFTAAQRRKPLALAGILIAGLLVATLGFVLPRYPAEAFSRVWIPFAILLVGLVGQAAWGWLAPLPGWGKTARQEGLPQFADSMRMLSPAGWVALAAALLGLLLVQTGVSVAARGASSIVKTAALMTSDQNVSLDSGQPARLLSQDCASVLYMSEVPMHFYFSRGALRCGAVFYPAVAKSPQQEQWVDKNKTLRYLVSWSPAAQGELGTDGSALALSPGDVLEVHTPGERPLKSVSVYLRNPGLETSLTVQRMDGAQPSGAPFKLRLPANFFGWLPVTREDKFASASFALKALGTANPVYVQGLRLEKDAPLNWPWDQQVSLVYSPVDPALAPRTILFESGTLSGALNLPVKILADQGDTVLAEITR